MVLMPHLTILKCESGLCSVSYTKASQQKKTLRKYLKIIYYHHNLEERKESLNAETLIYCSIFCNWKKCL